MRAPRSPLFSASRPTARERLRPNAPWRAACRACERVRRPQRGQRENERGGAGRETEEKQQRGQLRATAETRSPGRTLSAHPWRRCTAQVAAQLAQRAYERSVELGGGECAVGLGCTAALRSVPMRRGSHRCFISVRTARGVHSLTLTLAKVRLRGRLDRKRI